MVGKCEVLCERVMKNFTFCAMCIFFADICDFLVDNAQKMC